MVCRTKLKKTTTAQIAILASVLVSASSSHADSFSQCLKAETAIEKIERCSTVLSHSRQRNQLERAYLRRGNAYVEMSRFADAVNDFTALIHLNPRVAGYYDNRQNALKSIGLLGKALDDANMTVRLASSYAFSYRSRANVFDAMGRYDAAIADFTTALSIDPRDVGLLIDRGKILARAGRNREAIDDFTHALDVDGGAKDAFRERGLAYKKLGAFDAALADLTWFIRVEPADQEVSQAFEELRAAKVAPRREEPKDQHSSEANREDRQNGQWSESKKTELPGGDVTISAQDATVINKRIGDLGAQIEILTKVVREQSELKKDANVEVRVSVEETITALNNRIKQLKSEFDVKDEEFSRYLTSVRPNDRDFYLTARRASESYPKIPYYIPGTKEIGEFWIEPTVTDKGELSFGFKFVDTEASVEKVRGKIDMSRPEIEDVQKALLKLHEWSDKAHSENVRSYEKRVICFPEKECPPDGERIDGKSSTEIRFIVYEDGATAGRIQRNKGLFVEGYNVSIDSALMLQAYLNHVIKAANKEYTSGRRSKKELDDMFK